MSRANRESNFVFVVAESFFIDMEGKKKKDRQRKKNKKILRFFFVRSCTYESSMITFF
jgi:hypothetical protein